MNRSAIKTVSICYLVLVCVFGSGETSSESFAVYARPSKGPEISTSTPSKKPEKPKASRVFIASVSAYTASRAETDEDPFTTANGERVKVGGLACPSWLEFGTRVRLAGSIYRCNDRMGPARRDGRYFDIFMLTRSEAIEFGRQNLQAEILSD